MATRNRLALRSRRRTLDDHPHGGDVRAERPCRSVQPGPAPGAQARTLRRPQSRSSASARSISVNGFMSNRTPAERISFGYPPKVQAGLARPRRGLRGPHPDAGDVRPGEPEPSFLSYCIDLLTDTHVGVGLQARRVDRSERAERRIRRAAAAVVSPPRTNLDSRTKAAAVQSAIWYLSDGYVLPPTAHLYQDVSAIVTDVIAHGPLTAPPAAHGHDHRAIDRSEEHHRRPVRRRDEREGGLGERARGCHGVRRRRRHNIGSPRRSPSPTGNRSGSALGRSASKTPLSPSPRSRPSPAVSCTCMR